MAVAGLLALPAVAEAVTRQARVPDPAKPFFDSRVAERHAAAGRAVAATARERAARERLGRSAAVALDPLTGTARSVQRLDGALTGPAAGDRSAVALRWVRDNRAALGLTAADVDSLTLADRTLVRGSGFTHLRYRQSYGGIPAFDNGVRVNLDRGGRILSVTGSPLAGLRVDSTVPRLGAVAAMRALQRDVDVERAIDVTSGPAGDRRVTRFARGDFARLVLFGGAHGVRLAWHLTYQATSLAYYDAVVDATSGAILYRQNLTKFDAPATVFPNYPGAEEAPGPKGVNNAPRAVDFETNGWLTPAATTLDGEFAHAYADVDSDDVIDAGEEIPRTPVDDDFEYPFTEFPAPVNWENACDHTFSNPAGWPDPIAIQARCSWDPTDRDSWEANQNQNGVQAFYFANRFHDHLASLPIGFSEANDGFGGDDPVLVEANDGAGDGPGGGPDGNHINNANMSTPPDGDSPRMQMYLFQYDPDGGDDPDESSFFTFRNINGGDDAATVWHEYGHGLSNRLITNNDGSGAVSSPHAGAMGEAWSDWYALDLLHRENLEIDSALPGEVDIGVYSDAVFASTRFQPVDCPVGNDDAVCPGTTGAGAGGYTFGDFGQVLGFPEVHADGEIWTQTLWDLRDALIADAAGDEQVGADDAEALITAGMRMSPPEPSFLDARNAILGAAVGLGIDRALVWQVFADRGMGFFAGVTDSSDTAPREDFSMPPAPNGPKGRIAGTVTSADTGLPLANITVAFGGLSTGSAFPDFPAPARTAANGTYALTAPVGRYDSLVFTSAGGYDPITVADVAVTANATRFQNVALRRDWAARNGGGRVVHDDDRYDNTGAEFGCGLDQLIDQSRGTGWSAFNPASTNLGLGPPTALIVLPRTIDITAFGLDPSNTCGDDAGATTKGYKIETSGNGVNFAVARQGSFTMADRNRLNIVAPTANATNVRFVRLTLLSPQSAGADFIDFSELEVFGGPRNVLPSGPLQVSAATIAPGQSVVFDATQITDPDSKITGYDWDFDGNGTVDRSTSGPTTLFAYTGRGTFAAKVSVRDFRGGAGTATRQITVAPRPRVSLPAKGSKGKVTARVRCTIRCTMRAKLTLSRRQARALGLRKRSAGTLRRTITRTTTQRIAVRLSRAVRRRAKARGIKRVKATLSITVGYAGGPSTTKRRPVTIRL